ncbi:MAG: polysaccharide pyruvyl transferase family protein [Bacteroidales bacterium]|nr:polysaccharide pyruvyl transferase family protein [Bacteroidales bacterium]
MDKSNLNISEEYDSFEQLKSKSIQYDAVICGSDQIWNNDGSINPFYYLQFVDKTKRIAYAPSIARDYIDDRFVDIFNDYVQDIGYLSIREKQGAQLIKKITGREATVVLDPTLLLNKEQWEKQLPNNCELENKRYIFCYLLTKNDKYYNEVLELSKKLNMEVITPTLFSNHNNTSKNIDFFEFLNLIRYADYIATDSFHGVAFSLNFCKQFAVYKRFEDSYKGTQNSRIYNILNEFNLNDRLITENNELEQVISEIKDYETISNILDEKRQDSLGYLNRALKSVLSK